MALDLKFLDLILKVVKRAAKGGNVLSRVVCKLVTQTLAESEFQMVVV
jgi:hypothetical protein